MIDLTFPEPPLSDGVVALRPWTQADLEFVVDACQDPAVSRYSPAIPFPYAEADAISWFVSQEPARRAGQSIDFAIAAAASGAPLGAIGLHNFSPLLVSAETGYWLARSARGQGLASRALVLVARWAFAQLGLARLSLTTDPENVASQRVAERCGFQREGYLRSHMLVLHNGERRDSLVWGLLPGELVQFRRS